MSAAREQVWLGLNDPAVLAQCLDGCQSMEKVSDDRFDATVKAKIGPVSAVFKAVLTMSDVNPPESYTLTADVKGGPAGFGKGTAAVDLTEDRDATVLRYRVNAKVGGKLAQIGSRLIDGAARKMADDFFGAFGALMDESGAADVQRVDTADGPAAAGETAGVAQSAEVGKLQYEKSGQWKVWVVVFAVLVLAMVLTM